MIDVVAEAVRRKLQELAPAKSPKLIVFVSVDCFQQMVADYSDRRHWVTSAAREFSYSKRILGYPVLRVIDAHFDFKIMEDV